MEVISKEDYEQYFLIDKAQTGDKEAKETLLKQYSYLVKNTVSNYYISGGEAEDLVQEGNIAFCNAVDSFNTEKNCRFEYFAKLCIKRRAISVIKAYSRKKNIPLTNYCSLNEKPLNSENNLYDILKNDGAFDPLEVILEYEENDIVKNTINTKLSNLEKESILLKMKGYSYKDISELLNVKVKSIDNAIQRAKAKIEIDLKKEEYIY